ncbi:MAG: ABC transporter permease subunit [Bacillota bacterium]|nr:ABC transporter permease subunit [Bacillota bacterium]
MFRQNVFRQELRLNRRSLIVWGIVTVIVIGVYLGFFPYMKDPDLIKALDAYPEAIKSALSLNAAMFGDVNRYHGGLVMLYVLLMLTIYSFMLAGGLVARDSDLGTAEFLYTKPVTRSQLMTAKVSAFLCVMLVLWTLTLAASTVVGLMVAPGEYDIGVQLWIHVAGLLASLAAGGIAFAAAPFINRMQGTTSLGIGLGLGFFMIDAVSKMTKKLDALKYLGIHHYASLGDAAAGKPWVGGMLALLAIFAVGTALGYVGLNRKEFTG